MAFNLDSMSMIPIPPCSIDPIIVFLFIRSLVLHRKEYIILFMYLTSFWSGKFNIDATYISLEIANALIDDTAFTKKSKILARKYASFGHCAYFRNHYKFSPNILIWSKYLSIMETTGWYLSIDMCFVLVHCCVGMLMTSCLWGATPILGRKRISLSQPMRIWNRARPKTYLIDTKSCKIVYTLDLMCTLYRYIFKH